MWKDEGAALLGPSSGSMPGNLRWSALRTRRGSDSPRANLGLPEDICGDASLQPGFRAVVDLC